MRDQPEGGGAGEGRRQPGRPGSSHSGSSHPGPGRAEPHAGPRRGSRTGEASAREGGVWLHGLHPVAAALANPARRLRRLLLTEDAEATLAARLAPSDSLAVGRLPAARAGTFPAPGTVPAAGATPWRIAPERADRARIAALLPEDAVHQGAALLADPLPPMPLDRVLAQTVGPLLVLDQVTDPRNVGAILRSAAAFGAAAMVLQDRHAPPETGTLARAASGALEMVPVVREVNLARALGALKKAGLWVVGLDAAAPVTLAQVAGGLGGRRVALVLGAEGEGLRRLTRETCDELARLPIAVGMESLNVSAAAAVALYELARG